MTESDTTLDRDRRREIARDALETSIRNPYWLDNLAACQWFDDDAYADLQDTADQLREDAALLEEAHAKLEERELIPAEAALLIAERANFGEYDTRDHLYDSLPITDK